MRFILGRIDKYQAFEFVSRWHYAKVMPRLTKAYVAAYEGDLSNIAGLVTLGWGTQPRQTIAKLFPGLGTRHYFEIGKMCMREDLLRNSESQMLAAIASWIRREYPEKLFLFTWADGIVGKPGYVYQAAGFLYGGFIWTDIYLGKDGEKIHPRSARELLEENARFVGRDKLFWLTREFMQENGIRRIRGKQFRYILPLTRQARKLIGESTVEWSRNHPKHGDLAWQEMDGNGTMFFLPPDFDLGARNINRRNIESFESNQTRMDFNHAF